MSTPDVRTLEDVIAAHVLHPGESVCTCDNWRIVSLIDPPHITHAAHVAEQVREHLAPLSVLADEWANQPTDYDEDTEQQIEDGHDLRAALAATLGEGAK